MTRVENFKQALQLLCAGMQLYWIESPDTIWMVEMASEIQFTYTRYGADTKNVYAQELDPLEGYGTTVIHFADKELYIY